MIMFFPWVPFHDEIGVKALCSVEMLVWNKVLASVEETYSQHVVALSWFQPDDYVGIQSLNRHLTAH